MPRARSFCIAGVVLGVLCTCLYLHQLAVLLEKEVSTVVLEYISIELARNCHGWSLPSGNKPLWQVPVPQVRHAQRPTSLATSTAGTSKKQARSMSCRSTTHSCTWIDSDELLACIKACSSADTLCHTSMKAWGSSLDPHGKSGASHLDMFNPSVQCAAFLLPSFYSI